MSVRDCTRDGDKLPACIGRACFVTVAGNSIKLHLDENRPRGNYLWIDPSWQFGHGQDLITASMDCPSHREENYSSLFKDWAEKLSPVNESKVEAIRILQSGGLEIKFSHDYRLLALSGLQAKEDLEGWYDDWYVSLIETETATEL